MTLDELNIFIKTELGERYSIEQENERYYVHRLLEEDIIEGRIIGEEALFKKIAHLKWQLAEPERF